jgi:hypothetical protein
VTAPARTEPPTMPKPPPQQAYCKACGGWIATVPAGTAWVRGRCMNKRCQKYSEAQQIKTI